MKQVQLIHYDSPDGLQLIERNIPESKAGEGVIKVEFYLFDRHFLKVEAAIATSYALT